MSIRLASAQRYSERRVNRINLPVYAVTPNVSVVNEPGTVRYTVNTQYVAEGTSLYWTLDGTSQITDFIANVNSGTVTIANTSAQFTVNIIQDFFTEGTETVIARLRTVSNTGPIVATAPMVSILDTSMTPTITITPNVTSMNEGTSVSYTVSTINISDNTILYWTNAGTTSNVDFVDNANSGTFTITSNAGSIIRAVKADYNYEGGLGGTPETIILQVRLFSNNSPVVATANTVSVIDSSSYVPYSMEYLLVAGGGGGGGSGGPYADEGSGGGGAGGVITGTITVDQTIVVTVGAGGTGPASAGQGGKGGDSFVTGSNVAIGGGGGGFTDAAVGGSGGGAGGYYNPYGGRGGAAGTPGQGNAGGGAGPGRQSGGGGGKGGAGNSNGTGGASSTIWGNAVAGGGGGGGSTYGTTSGAPGGGAGAGSGGSNFGSGTSATVNTGSGGGGSGSTSNQGGVAAGGNGGSGLVVLRYTGAQRGTGGTITSPGDGYTYHTFTTSGSYNP